MPLFSAVDTTCTSAIPPLKGDGSGVYRIRVVGNSGAGKSTLADELGAMLGLPVMHLDRLFWNPGWIKTSSPEFQARVSATLAGDAYKRGWVADGNYHKRLTDQLDDATDVIWLDTPFLLYFPRLIKRTFLRLFHRREQCAPGCDERASKTFFSRESILWWAITNHLRAQKSEAARFQVEGVHVGGNMRRIGGWGRELCEWKQAVFEMKEE